MSQEQNRALTLWNRIAGIPGGRQIFRAAIGFMVPYASTVRPTVLELRPGHCRVQMRERRAVQNPFQSVHAAALMCLAETTSGLAMMTALPAESRGIVTGFDMRYLKKARGVLTAESSFEIPDLTKDGNHDVEVSIKNAAGEVVATGTAKWIVGPRPAEAK